MCRRLLLCLSCVALATPFEIPLIGGSSEEQLGRWLERAESLAASVSAEDLAKFESEAVEKVNKAQRGIDRALSWLRANVQLVEIAAGGLMLFWGKNIMHLLLFAQTVRLSGLGPLQRAFSDLKADIVNTTATLKQEVPSVISARDALLKLKAQQAAIIGRVEAVRAAALAGTSTYWFGSAATQADVKAAVLASREDLEEVMDQAVAMTSALSGISRLSAVLDPSRLQACDGFSLLLMASGCS